MKKIFVIVFSILSCMQLVVAQETRYFKYSHSVNTSSSAVQYKYSKSSSKYFYITCVDGDRFAEVHGTWNDAQTYANRYVRSSAFSSKYVQMTNMTDLVTGQPYILSEKYELYDINSGFEIYPRQYQKINAWGNASGWSYGDNFYALGDCCLIVREKGKDSIWHYYYELDMYEVEDLVELSRKYDPYNFDNIVIMPSTYTNTYDYGSTTTGSSYGANEREERMYRQHYAKKVSLFNSARQSLGLIERNYVAESQMRALLLRQQREMRDIRMEAQQKGIQISPAYEESMSF